MLTGLIGKKVGMTQLFREKGRVEAVTVLQAGPCEITQLKTEAKDGYQAVQIGFSPARSLSAPEKGHLKAAGGLYRHLREFPVQDLAELQVGQKLDVTIFEVGERVKVIGISKGKGFAGGVKRYHFRGGPKTHGQSDRHRAPGSIGTSTPGRTPKGLRMAGHMGARRTTVRGLRVVKIDPERNLLLVKGAVPGANNGLLLISKEKKGG